MKRRLKSKSIWLSLGAVLLLSYQNCAMPFSNGFTTVQDASLSSISAESRAMSILSQKCGSCHGDGQSSGNISGIDNPASLLSQNLIVYGDSSSSELVTVIVNGSMPKSGSAVTSSELNAIKEWIDGGGTPVAGAPAPTPAPASPVDPTFSSIQANILNQQCVSCHSAGGSQSNLTSYASVMASGAVVAGDPSTSDLYEKVSNGIMPLYQPVLNANQIDAIRQWIANGALNN